MLKHRYEATLPRAVLGFCIGVALLTAIQPIAMVIDGTDFDGRPTPRLSMLGLAVAFFYIPFVPYLIIVGLLAVPIWIFFHRRGGRSWYHAIAAGAADGFILIFVRLSLTMLFQTAHWEASDAFVPVPDGSWGDWLAVIKAALLPAVVGGIIGSIVWRIAYRRVADDSAPSQAESA